MYYRMMVTILGMTIIRTMESRLSSIPCGEKNFRPEYWIAILSCLLGIYMANYSQVIQGRPTDRVISISFGRMISYLFFNMT